MSNQEFRLLLRSSNVINRVPANSGLLRQGDEDANGLSGSELGAVHLVEAKLDGDPELRDSSAGLYFKVGTSLTANSADKIIRIGPTYVTTDGVRPDQRELNNDDVDYTGALWYRGDTKDFYINYTGNRDADAWELITAHYTNDTPTPFTLGGIPQGTTFDKTRFDEFINQLLYPDAAINLVKLRLDPDIIGQDINELRVEIGTDIQPPGGANLITLSIEPGPYHRITNVQYIGGTNPDEPLVAENIFTGGSYSGVGVNKLYTYSQNTVLSYNVPTTYFWGCRLTTTADRVLDGARRYITWTYKSFILFDSASNLTDVSGAAVEELDRPLIVEKPDSEDPEYIYVFLPIGRVIDDTLIADGYDPYTKVTVADEYGVAMSTLSTVDIVRNGVTVRYNRYRTTYQTAYSVKLVFE